MDITQLFPVLLSVIISVTILPGLVCSKKLQKKSSNHSIQCPPWTKLDNNGTCQCGGSLNGVVNCLSNGNQVQVLRGYCMTKSEKFNETVLARCDYSYAVDGNSYKVFDNANPTKDLCDILEMNRTGQLCGSCREGYALSVYSYSMACVKCDNYKYNWLKYIAIAFIPLTLFYIAVVIFRISATSGAACGYILTVQGLTSSPGAINFLLITSNSTWNKIFYNFLTLHSIWNLDFFRGLYPPFCLHPKLSTLEALALEYAIAVYPFILILVTYVCVKLHDHYPLVSRLWRPFYRCSRLIRKEWNITTSLIEVFSTFILLSYTKIVIASGSILRFTTIYNQQGKRLTPRYYFLDGNVKYFGSEHLPYAILAIFMVVVFNVLPVILLCLYPCRCFHRCLNACRFHSFVLHTFVENFQGHYKFHSRDLRYFAALYPLLRFISLVLIVFPTIEEFTFFVATILIISALLVAIYTPHKNEAHNTLNAAILAWNGFFCLTVLLTKNLVLFHIFTYALYVVGVLFDLGYITYWIVPKHISQFVKTKVNELQKRFSRQSNEEDDIRLTFDESTLFQSEEAYNNQPVSYVP